MKKILWLLLLLPLPLKAIDQTPDFGLTKLDGGVYTYPSANEIPDNAVSYMQNFFTDIQPAAVERNGYIKKETTQLGLPSAVTGLWTFYDINGNEWQIAFSSRTFYKSKDGVPFTAFGFQQTTPQVPTCTTNLGKFWCVDGTDPLFSFDGSISSQNYSAPIGKLIASWRNRIVIANINSMQSTAWFSEDGDGYTWDLGGAATDPFTIYFGGTNDGFPINCIYGMYQDALIIGRKFDLWRVDGFSQDDVQSRKLSSEVGCLQNGSMREFDGSLIFLSARGLEEMNSYYGSVSSSGDPIKFISEPIRDLTDTIVKNTVNYQYNLQTTQADWQTGSVSPSSDGPWLDTNVSPGSLTLATNTASTFVTYKSTDFNNVDYYGGYSNTNISTTAITSADATDGVVGLSKTGSENIISSNTNLSTPLQSENGLCTGPFYMGRSFTPPTTSYVTSISIYGIPGSSQRCILRLVSGDLSTVLAQGTFDPATMSGKSWYPVDIYPYVYISSGTRYFIQLVSTGPCTEPYDPFSWFAGTDTYTRYINSEIVGGEYYLQGSTAVVVFPGSYNLLFKISSYTFQTSGTYTSQPFDVGTTTQSWIWSWDHFYATGIMPSTNTAITYQTCSQVTAGGLCLPLTSVSTDTVVVTTNSIPISPLNRYIRVVATLTSNGKESPQLTGFQVGTTSKQRPYGSYISQGITVGSSITAWGPIVISDKQQNSGIIQYYFGSTSYSGSPGFACSLHTSNWQSISAGQIPSVTLYGGGYACFKASFTATVGTSTVSLDSFQTQWVSGNTPAVQSYIWDRRYWLSITTNTSGNPYLDTVLVYQRNRTFTLLKGINAASFTRWKDNLYFGDSTGLTGQVYQYDFGNSDDGNPITSIIKTKSYDLGYTYRDKDLRKMFVGYYGLLSYGGNFSLGYDIDRSGNNYSLGSANMNDGGGQIAAKFPFSLNSNPVQGREIQYNLVKSGTGDRLKLYELHTFFTLKETP